MTVFHRGEHPAPPGVRVRHGDRTREDGLAALATGEWDAVVDTWSGAPTVVRDAADLLAGRTGRHAFVSSRSVYAWPVPVGLDEFGPLAEGDPDAQSSDFAADKRGSELAVLRAFGEDRTLLVRPGLILGPRENAGRLPWWLSRIARGGEIPAPGPRDTPLQYVDVRDLAAWLLDALESSLHGPYNLVSQPGHTTIGELLDLCVRVTGGAAGLRWTSPRRSPPPRSPRGPTCPSGPRPARTSTPRSTRETSPGPTPRAWSAARSPRRSPTPGPGSSPSRRPS